ncbi:pyruvate kinase 1, cytosolic-like [Aristolochia californica]|uniref:pyruvate kinase 1, cytosolic-like n=1 Tax=Aristolochia californica TaxID=171875 RepID=UPI0035DE6779
MQGGRMVVEEPVRLASLLMSAKQNFSPSLTKIIGTLGPKSRSVEVLSECLKAGMSVARFDFSWLNDEYHQETLDSLRAAMENVKKLCAVMLDTVGPEIQVINKSGKPIVLKANDHITITPDLSGEPSHEVLPINYLALAKRLTCFILAFQSQHKVLLGVFKLNFDGSSLGNPRIAGFDGVICDSLGI